MVPAGLVGLPRGTMSLIAPEAFFNDAISAPARPSATPAFWSAIAQIAENTGLAKLVPPITSTKPPETIMAPVNGSATAEMSGCCRFAPGIPRFFCHDGFAMKMLSPPPAPPFRPSANGGSFTASVAKERNVALLPQPTSHFVPSVFGTPRLVPPIEVANVELAGNEAPPAFGSPPTTSPLSPDEKFPAMPAAAAF